MGNQSVVIVSLDQRTELVTAIQERLAGYDIINSNNCSYVHLLLDEPSQAERIKTVIIIGEYNLVESAKSIADKMYGNHIFCVYPNGLTFIVYGESRVWEVWNLHLTLNPTEGLLGLIEQTMKRTYPEDSGI